jgi:hypothetical protein
MNFICIPFLNCYNRDFRFRIRILLESLSQNVLWNLISKLSLMVFGYLVYLETQKLCVYGKIFSYDIYINKIFPNLQIKRALSILDL